MNIHNEKYTRTLFAQQQIDCAKCSGLCCVALFFAKSEGFPADKAAGIPCNNLRSDFTCSIHHALLAKNMYGCLRYDCMGAGQKVTQTVYKGETWRTLPQRAEQLFAVFHTVCSLQQMQWFLKEARTILPAEGHWAEIDTLLDENEGICSGTPESIMAAPLDAYRQRVNRVLKAVGADVGRHARGKGAKVPGNCLGKNFAGTVFTGADFSMQLLIAADFSRCTFHGANFLGADTRDTNFCGADLQEALFLTQGQINSAKGDAHTRLPAAIERPAGWA